MFLFRMHSVGRGVRPRPSAAAAVNHWWGDNRGNSVMSHEPTPEANQMREDPLPMQANELEEDVVVIQEEEMVLLRKEKPEPEPEPEPVDQVQEPQPKCTEPETTVSSPLISNKNKKKHKRK